MRVLITDDKETALYVDLIREHPGFSYTAYGYESRLRSTKTVLAFSGEPSYPDRHGMFLGNGYRYYLPTLMRFCSPDSWSPFAIGSVNAYCYCLNDPVNRVDRTGHVGLRVLAKTIVALMSLRQRPVPYTGSNGLLIMNGRALPSPFKKPTAYIAPFRPLSITASTHRDEIIASIQSSPSAGTSVAPAQLARTNGGLEQDISLLEPELRSTGMLSSASASRDSTPLTSRSSSPIPQDLMQNFVGTATEVRQSPFYSKRFN